jgi:3-deoxy-D-manno-octulosonic-acid transferase
MVRSFIERVLADLDLALMQTETDAERIRKLGIEHGRVSVTGNLKFDHSPDERDTLIAAELRDRFGIFGDVPLIVAASTHDPEERLILESLRDALGNFRLLIAPRHPERFENVASVVRASGLSIARRSDTETASDRNAKVILLDSMGELRGAYQLADIVFVGGSLIPHGGQSILEPAAAGKAILTGPYTSNFAAVVEEFKRCEALIQLERSGELVSELSGRFSQLLEDSELRKRLGDNAAITMKKNQGAAEKTVELLSGKAIGR